MIWSVVRWKLMHHLAEANVAFTGAQTKNTSDDNAKQLAVAIDKHFQEWADLGIKAVKEGAQLPPTS